MMDKPKQPPNTGKSSRSKREAAKPDKDKKDTKEDKKEPRATKTTKVEETKKTVTASGRLDPKLKCYVELSMFRAKQLHQKMNCKQFGVSDDFLGKIIHMGVAKALLNLVGKPVKMPMGMGGARGKESKGSLTGMIQDMFMDMPGPNMSGISKGVREQIMLMFDDGDDDDDRMKGMNCTTGKAVNNKKPCMMRKDMDHHLFAMDHSYDLGLCLYDKKKMVDNKEEMIRRQMVHRWNREFFYFSPHFC
jgi:hypothetical protein